MYPKHRYISNEVYRLLINKKCSIIYPDVECVISPGVLKYPTQDQVIDWLEAEYNIFVYTFPLFDFEKYNSKFIGKYGVSILTGDRSGYGAERNYKSKEEAINAALLKVLKDLI